MQKPTSRWSDRLLGWPGDVLLALLPFALYVWSLPFPLLQLDDLIYFQVNPLVHDGAPAGALAVWTGQHYGYTPLTHLSIWCDLAIAGQDSWSFARFHQLLWFSLGVLGVRHAISRLTGDPWLGFLAALVYAVHPLCAPSALWLALRRQVVCVALLFWALDAHLRARAAVTARATVGWAVAALALALGSVFGRFHGVVIVGLMAGAELLLPAIAWRRRLALLAPVAVVMAAFTVFSLATATDASLAGERLGGSLLGGLWSDGGIVLRQLAHVVWPWNLTAYYGATEAADLGWRDLAAWAAVAVIIAVTLIPREPRRLVAVCWLLAAIAIAPCLNLVSQVFPMADHYVQPSLPFLAVIGIVLVRAGLAAVARRQAINANWPVVLVGAAVLLLAPASLARLAHFSDSLAFFRQAVRAAPTGFNWGYLAHLMSTSPDPRLRAQAGPAAVNACLAPDHFRLPVEPRISAILGACGHLHQQGRDDMAQGILDRCTADMDPGIAALLRTMVLLDRQAYAEALAVMVAQPPVVDDATISALWERSGHGRFLPDPARGGQGGINTIDHRQQDRLWLLRTLTLRATCHHLVGEHEAAARFALVAAAIDPRMIRPWEILAPALTALGCTEGADQARRNQARLEQEKAAGALDVY